MRYSKPLTAWRHPKPEVSCYIYEPPPRRRVGSREQVAHALLRAVLALVPTPVDSRFSPTTPPAPPPGPNAAPTLHRSLAYTPRPPRTRRCDNLRSNTLCARFSRDATVPAEHPRISAIWSYARP